MNIDESESKGFFLYLFEVLTPLDGTFSVCSDQFNVSDGRF